MQYVNEVKAQVKLGPSIQKIKDMCTVVIVISSGSCLLHKPSVFTGLKNPYSVCMRMRDPNVEEKFSIDMARVRFDQRGQWGLRWGLGFHHIYAELTLCIPVDTRYSGSRSQMPGLLLTGGRVNPQAGCWYWKPLVHLSCLPAWPAVPITAARINQV